MRRKRRWGVLRMLLAFFAGVLVTLFLLIPGKTGPTVLVNGSVESQLDDLSVAGVKIEQVGETALVYAYRAKDYLQMKIGQESRVDP